MTDTQNDQKLIQHMSHAGFIFYHTIYMWCWQREYVEKYAHKTNIEKSEQKIAARKQMNGVATCGYTIFAIVNLLKMLSHKCVLYFIFSLKIHVIGSNQTS